MAAFLRKAHAQSGFKGALGECNAITSHGFGHSELTFVDILEIAFTTKFTRGVEADIVMESITLTEGG